MKKYCLVALLTLCLALCLVGCGDKEDEVIVPDVQDESIQSVFNSSFEVDNIEKYDFTLIYESNQDFNVYEIVDRTLEKTEIEYTYNNNIYVKNATGQFDPFDLFIYRNGTYSSFWDLVSRNRLGFGEVEHLMKEYLINQPEDFGDSEFNLVEDMIEELQNKELLSYPIYNNCEEPMTAAYFNLSNADYVWTILNVDDLNEYFDCVFAAKYETEEQKASILKGFDYRKEKLKASWIPDEFKEIIWSNQRIYEIPGKNTIIYFSAMNPVEGVYEFMEEYLGI